MIGSINDKLFMALHLLIKVNQKLKLLIKGDQL